MPAHLYDQYDQYLENLLCAQYDVAGIFNHELTKGEVREDFLIKLLHESNDHMRIHKGVLSNGTTNSNQCDLLICRPNTHIRRLGGQAMIDVGKQPILIEVKGNATGTDFKEFNIKAGRAKSLCTTHDIPCGIFCYRTMLTHRTIMKRFGYRYDAALDPLGIAYLDDPTLPLDYPNIDFAVCIEVTPAGMEDKQFFLRKDPSTGNPTSGRYIYSREAPVIKHMMSLVRSLTM